MMGRVNEIELALRRDGMNPPHCMTRKQNQAGP